MLIRIKLVKTVCMYTRSRRSKLHVRRDLRSKYFSGKVDECNCNWLIVTTYLAQFTARTVLHVQRLTQSMYTMSRKKWKSKKKRLGQCVCLCVAVISWAIVSHPPKNWRIIYALASRWQNWSMHSCRTARETACGSAEVQCTCELLLYSHQHVFVTYFSSKCTGWPNKK